jgi:phosphatidylserine decarboxylase
MVSASRDLSLSARLFVGLQYCLPQHLLSRGVRWLTRATLFKRPLIAAFMRGFKPQMHDALEPDPMAYKTFNAFFTRALRTGARSLPADVNAIACPVDGAISSFGPIHHDTLWQAKGQTYSLPALLAGDAEAAAHYRDGSFLTIYLAPYNYHRIHMPINGTLTAATYVPGALFSVNNTTAALVPGLFARNERVVCAFDSSGQPFSVILVGALFVGSMSTVWHAALAIIDAATRRRARSLQYGLHRYSVVPEKRRDAIADTASRPGGTHGRSDWTTIGVRAPRLNDCDCAPGCWHAPASSSLRARCWRLTRRCACAMVLATHSCNPSPYRLRMSARRAICIPQRNTP